MFIFGFFYGFQTISGYVTSFSTKDQTFSHSCISSSLVKVSGLYSMAQHTRTTVLWPWRTLVKVMMPCSAWLTKLLVADLLILCFPWGTGSFPMELEFLAVVSRGTFTEQEVRVWYFCKGEEVERKESTVVRYLMQWILLRPYTLECTIEQTLRLVSDKDWVAHILFCFCFCFLFVACF